MKRHHEPCQQLPGYCARPGTGPHCLCGVPRPDHPRGGHPILPAAEWQEIERLARGGDSFAAIANQTGKSVHLVRRVVHGI